jgi:hypothetical protein
MGGVVRRCEDKLDHVRSSLRREYENWIGTLNGERSERIQVKSSDIRSS